MMSPAHAPPPYPTGHGLLVGKRVLITAAAGTGIGFATARRCIEEGATVFVKSSRPWRLPCHRHGHATSPASRMCAHSSPLL
jgi:NAD(P)-dependent dehydrogenase (short-subunit alcohol dehydrogenase family)